MFESTSVINFNQVIDALQNSAQPFPENSCGDSLIFHRAI